MDSQEVIQHIRWRDFDSDHPLMKCARLVEHSEDVFVRETMSAVVRGLAELDIEEGDKSLEVLGSYAKQLFSFGVGIKTKRKEAFPLIATVAVQERVEDIVVIALQECTIEIYNNMCNLLNEAVRERDKGTSDAII